MWTSEGVPHPEITFTPFERRALIERANAVIERHRAHSFHVALQIPARVLSRIYAITRTPKNDPLSYILLSEPESKTLRVFFPKMERARRMLPVAFTHTDMPGALSSIADAVGQSSFNIFTSLIRKDDPERRE